VNLDAFFAAAGERDRERDLDLPLGGERERERDFLASAFLDFLDFLDFLEDFLCFRRSGDRDRSRLPGPKTAEKGD
jgi:hypothetical protein